MMDVEESQPMEEVTNHEATLKLKRTWLELKQEIRTLRRQMSIIPSKIPQCFEFKEIVAENESRFFRIYFLSSIMPGHEVSLLYCDVPVDCAKNKNETFEWHPLLELEFRKARSAQSQYSREEQLQMERKRTLSWGITTFDYHSSVNRFVFPTGGNVYYCDDNAAKQPPYYPNKLRNSSEFPTRLNPQMCPWNPNLIAYVYNHDIWVHNIISASDVRLTYAKKDPNDSTDPFSAGMPSYVTQEEFNRFTGFWWQPVSIPSGGNIYRLLYEELDESSVDLIYLPSFGNEKELEIFRFPRAGTSNALSTLKIAQFKLNFTEQIEVLSDLHLRESLTSIWPEKEYLARVGWTPDGRNVWADIVNRQQSHEQLLLLPLSSFISNDPSLDFFTNHIDNAPVVQVIYEVKSDVWINIHDALYFFSHENKNEITFLWSSEETGFRHLYLVTVELLLSNNCDTSDGMQTDLCNRIKKVQLTSGNWEVSEVNVWVNEKKRLIYFIGLKDTPLERHLYVVNIDQPQEPVRLTSPGYSHTISMNYDCTLFVSIQSNVGCTPHGQVYQIYYSADHPVKVNIQPLGNFIEPTTCPSFYRPPELFSHCLKSGHVIYGMLFKPPNIRSGEKYPTVLTIYGGPEVQLVTNSFKGMRFMRQYLLASMGYVVVSIDCRGSRHRGIAFESHIKGRMGTVEIADQVEVLLWLSESTGIIDMNKIAVHGWSYGGYLSLMALIQRPDIFKIAIAGAPVTAWNMYDTGYTEKYMDTPDKNSSGYTAGSVLTHVNQFPDEQNRLLIIHGLRDENVHFAHSSKLINALVKAGKPYQLQVYPSERHSLRNVETNEHYETTLLSFLEQNL